MKKILGLDLGTTSIGWALVNEAESAEEKSSIIRMGVRLVPLDNFKNSEGKDIKQKKEDAFCAGISMSTRAARRNARSARINNERYKQRREELKKIFRSAGWIENDTPLCEDGKGSTYELLRLRAKAVSEEVSLAELSRILLAINKKRGYKSNRKLKAADEGEAIDGMTLARELYDKGLTPGQYVYRQFLDGKKYVPQFYPSDLKSELEKIWNTHVPAFPQLTVDIWDDLLGKNGKATWAILDEALQLEGIKKPDRQKLYEWRASAVTTPLDKEQFATVVQMINTEISNTSGYLGEISDRSKLLYFKHQTIGQHLWSIIQDNPHTSLKCKVFYREDYMDEFEHIWETQCKFHPELTEELKRKIRDCCIFYQRPLKSQKGTLDFCTFERHEKKKTIHGKEVTVVEGLKVCPKSSPIYQEFRIWQVLNNLELIDKRAYTVRPLTQDEKEIIFAQLNMSDKMTKNEVLKLIVSTPRKYDLNYEELPGNTTRTRMYEAFVKMLPVTGHDEIDLKKARAKDVEAVVRGVFETVGFNTAILDFDATLEGEEFQQQPSYRLWHLLYSSEGKNLKENISDLCGMGEYDECAKILSKISFVNDYGSLSTKAIRKILPHMKAGMKYDEACEKASYRPSPRSLTREERDRRVLPDQLPQYRNGSLRNPVVDKVLAQMTNVVNAIIREYGKPDEVRVEMAREMKKNASERRKMSDAIQENTKEAKRISKLLKDEFGIQNATRNQILRWRLYEELAFNGYHTLYSNQHIPQEKVLTKEIEIEHIIPQARYFDDSFANKTLEYASVNLEKGADTAYDYICGKYDQEKVEEYEKRINDAFVDKKISKRKRGYLLMKQENIPDDFVQRDLRETQYITRKALEMLESVIPSVVATCGSITDYLRKEWQLIGVLKELNADKIKISGLQDTWTKRADNRHHAMDALTVAYTKRGFVQYLKTLNAHYNEGKPRKITPPMPVGELRHSALLHLGSILISARISKKVATAHYNKKTGQMCMTPRGPLHAETYYGHAVIDGKDVYTTRKAVDDKLDVSLVVNERVRKVLEHRLAEYGGDAKKAFAALDNNPIWLDRENGICVKKVTIRATRVKEPIPIHTKHNHHGLPVMDKESNRIPCDFVAPDANHHIAFYKDAKGKLHENTVTFFEAFERKRQGADVIDTNYRKEDGWQFLFSLQRGEYVILPDKDNGFDPKDYNLTDPDNLAIISRHLFIVQKLSKKDYWFRHHLDPTSDEIAELRGINWERILSISNLDGIVKVRIDSLGQIKETTLLEV